MADRSTDDVENHRKLLQTVKNAVGAASSAAMPSAEEYYYYTHSSSEFRDQTSGFLDRIQSILTKCVPQNGEQPSFSIASGDVEDVLDWATTMLLDSAMDGIDDALAIAKCPPVVDDAERPSLTVGGRDGTAGAGVVKGTPSNKRQKQSYVSYMQSTMKEKPQRQFKDAVDNSNTPFIHNVESLKGLVEGADSTTHPLKQSLDALQYPSFVTSVPDSPEPYRSFEDTPFQFVESADELYAVAKRISESKEIAVDLEAHNYRSFQGFCCLMQISTRTEDIIVDVLKLREHVGKALAPIFANPDIIKVLHGSDGDIVWLQRDFGIYTCNLFDTGQAVRVLNYPGHGLAYLLQKHCSFKADKRWQLADWRIRPLSDEAIHYARADTHFLLFCYDVLRKELAECSTVPEQLAIPLPSTGPQGALGTVLERSKQICLLLYEKELHNETSFMTLYSKAASESLSDQQLSVFAALYDWRDKIAREEDESLGYVLSRNQLLNISRALPTSEVALSIAAGKSAHVVHRKASQVLSIIRTAMFDTQRAVSVRKAWIENGNTELRKPATTVNGLTADMYTAAVSAGAIVSTQGSNSETPKIKPKAAVLCPKKILSKKGCSGLGSMVGAFSNPTKSYQHTDSPPDNQDLLEKIKSSLALPTGYAEEACQIPDADGGKDPEVVNKVSAADVRAAMSQLQAENQREEGEIANPPKQESVSDPRGDVVDDFIPLSISEEYGLKTSMGMKRQKQGRRMKSKAEDESRDKNNAVTTKKLKRDVEGGTEQEVDYTAAVDKYKSLLSDEGGTSQNKKPRHGGKSGRNQGKGHKREQSQSKWADPFGGMTSLPTGIPTGSAKRSSVMVRKGNKSMVFK